MANNRVSKENIINWRRHLHRHPELSFHEVETSNYIYNILESFGVYKLERLTPTSVLATLETGRPGKTIALRADIDALPIHEEAEVEFISETDGVMHACGHDAHTSMLLGAAEVIATMTDQLNGTLKLIFQHAEELAPGGAQELVKAGVMDGVDMVFGLHVAPMIPTGAVVYLDGPLTAASDAFILNIQGKGAHGSMPDLSIDPINIGVEIVNSINHIVSREINAFDTAVISIGKFAGGSAPNIIPDTVEIQGTVRTLLPDTRTFVEERIKSVIEHITAMHGATYELTYRHGYDSVRNNTEATEVVVEAAKKVVAVPQLLIEGKTIMGSEDFSAYTSVTPGSFFILGCGTKEEGYAYINHHPKFILDENAFTTGSEMFVQIVEDTLGEK